MTEVQFVLILMGVACAGTGFALWRQGAMTTRGLTFAVAATVAITAVMYWIQ